MNNKWNADLVFLHCLCLPGYVCSFAFGKTNKKHTQPKIITKQPTPPLPLYAVNLSSVTSMYYGILKMTEFVPFVTSLC